MDGEKGKSLKMTAANKFVDKNRRRGQSDIDDKLNMYTAESVTAKASTLKRKEEIDDPLSGRGDIIHMQRCSLLIPRKSRKGDDTRGLIGN